MLDKPKGWEETVNDLIRANFDYQNTNMALKKKFGDIGAIGGDVYRQMKEKIMGGAKVDEKIDDLGTRKRVQKPKKPPAWNKQKQTQADSSKLAQIINMGVYQGMLPFCANQELKEEHVQEINPGGAVVANISYFFPESKLEHPLVMLGIRVVILYIKFKSVCGRIKDLGAKDNVVHVGKAGMGAGLKPGMKTDARK
jgi:hypothetical protein